MHAARHVYFFKVLAARKTYLITAHARKNKRTARMLASARKDHSIPLHLLVITRDVAMVTALIRKMIKI